MNNLFTYYFEAEGAHIGLTNNDFIQTLYLISKSFYFFPHSFAFLSKSVE